MQHIETIELTSAQSSITFSSIPQDYDDLVLVISARSSDTSNEISVRFNGVSTTVYSRVYLRGDGSSAASFSFSGQNRLILSRATSGSGATSNTFGSVQLYISNYKSSSNKSISADFVNENNATGADQTIFAGLWAVSSAISSIELLEDTANFVSGCTASLYGITAGGDGTVTTA